MADYYANCVLQPYLPENLVTDADEAFLSAFGFAANRQGGAVYLYAEEYTGSGMVYDDPVEGEREVEEADLSARLQEIIRRSRGAVPWISLEFAYTCSKMKSDGFGGSAWFITGDSVEDISTSGWLQEKIRLMAVAA